MSATKDPETTFSAIPSEDPHIDALAAEIGAALAALRRRVPGHSPAWLASEMDVEPGVVEKLELGGGAARHLGLYLAAVGCGVDDLAEALKAAARRASAAWSTVDDDDEVLSCSFCGKQQAEVGRLIAGPTVFVCDECVDVCLAEVARQGSEERRRDLAQRILRGSDEAVRQCSFCFKSHWEVRHLIPGRADGDYICDWCTYAAADALNKAEHLRKISAYLLQDKVESQVTGIVWKAYDERCFRSVMIKRLIPPCSQLLCLDPRALCSLDHPAVVATYEILRDEAGTDWVVCAPTDGKTLQRKLSDNWLGRREPLDVPAILRLARDVAAGLQAAHDHGIVHRHLNAENILLRPNGRAQVRDFSLGVPVGWSGQAPGISTLQTMTPEQFAGEPLGAQTDLFALGRILFEATTGKTPFHDGSRFMEPYEVMRRVCEGPRPLLRQQDPRLPESLEILVDRLLARDPEARPASAKEVVQALSTIEDELRAT